MFGARARERDKSGDGATRRPESSRKTRAAKLETQRRPARIGDRGGCVAVEARRPRVHTSISGSLSLLACSSHCLFWRTTTMIRSDDGSDGAQIQKLTADGVPRETIQQMGLVGTSGSVADVAVGLKDQMSK